MVSEQCVTERIIESEVRTYLSFLDSDAEYFSFFLLPADGKSYPKNLICSIDEALSALRETPIGTTLHVTLNATKPSGRKTKDVLYPRVLCVDLDRRLSAIELQEIKDDFNPHLLVTSSPGKFHLYWKVSPTLDLDTWSKFQLALAYHFKADKNLCQKAKTIRVPGVARNIDGVNVMPGIVTGPLEPTPELTLAQIQSLFPFLDADYDAAIVEQAEERKLLKQALKLPGKNTSAKLQKLGRNNAVYLTVREHAACLTDRAGTALQDLSAADALNLGAAINEKFSPPLEMHELEQVCDSALRHGLLSKQWKAERIIKEQKMLEPVVTPETLVDCGEMLAAVPMEQAVAAANTAGGSLILREQEPTPEMKESNPTPVVQVQVDPTPANGTNGHSSTAEGTFKYNYETAGMKKNRFSDASLLERVVQRFGQDMAKVGKVTFAFDPRGKVWRNQAGCADVLAKFVNTCALDTCSDPEFIARLCTTADGAVSRAKKHTWQCHFLANTLAGSTITGLQRVNSIRRLEGRDFDANPDLLFCANGVLDMTSGILREPRSIDYLLKRTAVHWDKNIGPSSWFIEFLSQVFAENENPAAMVNFMQELFGYSLSGRIDAQKIFVHYGTGSNGKSKVLECLAALAGEYTSRMACSSFSKNKNAVQKEFDRVGAAVEGSRVVILDDLDSKTQWNEGFVKGLTAPTITARKLYEEKRDVPNRAKVHIGCNDAPAPESENYGILRRLCIIPYQRQFDPRADKEAEINSRIQSEIQGILTWAVQGYQRTLSNGGQILYPKELETSVRDYKDAHFSVEKVLDEITADPESDADCHSVNAVLETLSQELNQRGLSSRIPSNEILGRLLAKKFRGERTYQEGRRVRIYFCKILNPKNQNSENFSEILKKQ